MPDNRIRWISELARTQSGNLLAIARHEGLTATDALDAAQQAFYALLEVPDGYALAPEREDAERQMAALVRNAARNMRRQHHRARPHLELDALEATSDDEPGAEEVLALAERHAALLSCVKQLAEIQRQVVTLRVLQEAATAEVAHRLELSQGHVAVMIHRAKIALRACLLRRSQLD